MKKLTLDDSWRLCLEQWDWIVEQIKAGGKRNMFELKEAWVHERGFMKVQNDCFFCEYDHQHENECQACPVKEIDPDFHCSNSEHLWFTKPLDFHAELHRLNKIRLAKKAKK